MRQEHRHHTDEQIREAIGFGLDEALQEDVPDELRVAVFQSAVSLRCAKSITEVQPEMLAMPAMTIPGQR